jgi:hypothetical protein
MALLIAGRFGERSPTRKGPRCHCHCCEREYKRVCHDDDEFRRLLPCGTACARNIFSSGYGEGISGTEH